MQLRNISIGLLLSALVAVPVVATARTSTLSNNNVPIVTAVANTHDSNTTLFESWSSSAGQWILTFGDTGTEETATAGVRINAPAGQKAKNFTALINTTNSGTNGYFVIFALPPGSSTPVFVGAEETQSPITNLGPAFTTTTKVGGFTQYSFDPKLATGYPYPFPTNGSFSSIYFGDGNPFAWSDKIKKVTVNGTDAFANVQPVFEYDSTLDA